MEREMCLPTKKGMFSQNPIPLSAFASRPFWCAFRVPRWYRLDFLSRRSQAKADGLWTVDCGLWTPHTKTK